MTTNIKGYVITDWLQRATGDPSAPYQSLYRVKPHDQNYHIDRDEEGVFIGFNPPNGEMVTVKNPLDQGFRYAKTIYSQNGANPNEVFSNTQYGMSATDLHRAVLEDLHQQHDQFAQKVNYDGQRTAGVAYNALRNIDQTQVAVDALSKKANNAASATPQIRGFVSMDGQTNFIAVPNNAEQDPDKTNYEYFKINTKTGEAEKVYRMDDQVVERPAQDIIDNLTPDNWNPGMGYRNRSALAMCGILNGLRTSGGVDHGYHLVRNTLRVREVGSQGNPLLNDVDKENLKAAGGELASGTRADFGEGLREAGAHGINAAKDVLKPSLDFLGGKELGSLKLAGGLILGALGAKTMGLESKGFAFWAMTFLIGMGLPSAINAIGTWFNQTADNAGKQVGQKDSDLNKAIGEITSVFTKNGGAKQVTQPAMILGGTL